MRLGFVMRDGLQARDYFRDLRWLIGGLAEHGLSAALLAEPDPYGGAHFDGLPDDCELFTPAEADRFFDSIEVVHNWNNLFILPWLKVTARKTRPDALLVQSLHSTLMDLAIRKSRSSMVKKTAYMQAARPLLKRIDGLHVYSETEVRESTLSGRLGRLPRFRAQLGLFPPPEGDSWAEVFGEIDAPFRFVYFGRNDVYHKGIDLALEGFDRFCSTLNAEERDGVAFLLVGRATDSDASFIDSFVERHPTLPIRRHGPCEESAVHALFSGASVFVYTSRHDGPPNPPRVALSMGCPLIITPQTNMAEVVERHGWGWTADPDPAAIAAAFSKAFRDRDEYRQRRDATASAAIKLSWKEVSSDYLAGYEYLLCARS